MSTTDLQGSRDQQAVALDAAGAIYGYGSARRVAIDILSLLMEQPRLLSIAAP